MTGPETTLRRRSVFLLCALAVSTLVVLATTYTLWRLRAEAIERLFDTADMYARSFEAHLTQNLNVIGLTLDRLADDAGSDELARALHNAPYLRSLSRLDGDGRIGASSNPRNLGVAVDRQDFLPAPNIPGTILRVALPWQGRDFADARPATTAQPAAPEALTLIPLLRLASDDAGAGRGLLAAINSDYFLNYYQLNLGSQGGSVELLRLDGSVLLSTETGRRPGTASDDQQLAALIAADRPGSFARTGDDRSALTAFRPSRDYPFAIAVHLDREHGLASWRREATRTVITALLVLASALAASGVYFLRHEKIARQHDADVEQLRLRSAALEAAANSIIITGPDGCIEWANPAFCELSGYTMTEIIGRNPRALIKSGVQDSRDYGELWRTILGGRVWRGELINRRRDGSHYIEDQTITPVLDENGQIRNFIAVKQDITARRQTEQRMEELSRHLVAVQESARRRLAGELHDRTSPNLAAIGVHLDIMADGLDPAAARVLGARLEDVRALLEDTTASIREISSDLRPPILDYAGLAAALDSYLAQFQRRTGIAVDFHCRQPEIRLPAATESVLFRIVQESLTNCAKHSRARRIEVSLDTGGDCARLRLCDDGIGFDPDRLGQPPHESGLGILTMRDMAEFSGGECRIRSSPERGTCIEVDIPLNGESA